MGRAGKAVFEIEGGKTVVVGFDTISELRDQEDNLTWEHWPNEVQLVEVEYTPVKAAMLKAAE